MLDGSCDCVNPLNTSWTLWIHLPHDTNWDINSYKKIYTFNYLEQACSLLNYIQENLVINCMLFIMRDDIKPIWKMKKIKMDVVIHIKSIINRFIIYGKICLFLW